MLWDLFKKGYIPFWQECLCFNFLNKNMKPMFTHLGGWVGFGKWSTRATSKASLLHLSDGIPYFGYVCILWIREFERCVYPEIIASRPAAYRCLVSPAHGSVGKGGHEYTNPDDEYRSPLTDTNGDIVEQNWNDSLVCNSFEYPLLVSILWWGRCQANLL